MSDSGGWMWLIIDVVFVVLLAVGLLWGMLMWQSRRRNRETEQATKELYKQGAEKERRGADA